MAKQVVYTLSVTLTMPLAANDDDVDFYTEEVATSTPRKREIERSVLGVLRRVEGDADVELMDTVVEDE